MDPSIALLEPSLGGNAKRYLEECLDSTFVSSVGPLVERFEKEFAAWVGVPYAVACSSGTAALHIAMRLLGSLQARLVAVSAFTFIGSVNPVSYEGAFPLLVDSERETWNLDPELIYDEVVRLSRSGKALPAAIEVVHIFGHPANLEPLMQLREEFGIPIIEDAAEALGAAYSSGPLAGRQVGSIGDVGCFSFNGNKVITTGGGGMVVTQDSEMAARARHLACQAKVPGREYLHDELGYNYRLTNLAAALGLAQLELLPEFLLAKREIAARYRNGLKGLPLEMPPEAPWAEPSHWLFSVLLKDGSPPRDQVIDELALQGIQARTLWLPAHKQPPHINARMLGGMVSDHLNEVGISLPSSVDLTADDQDRVIFALRSILGG